CSSDLVRLARIQARPGDDELDGTSRAVLGGRFHRGPEAEHLHGVVDFEDRAIELRVLLEPDARPHGGVALHAGAADDAVADRGVGSAKNTSAPGTSTGRCTRQPARTSF